MDVQVNLLSDVFVTAADHVCPRCVSGVCDGGSNVGAACAVDATVTVALGSGNTVLCSLLDGLSGPTTRARIWRGLTQEGAVDKTREQHTAICDAIESRQPEVARAWATVHIAGVEQWLRSTLVETEAS